MFKHLWKVTIVLAIMFLALTAMAATAAQDRPAVKTVMLPDLSLKTMLVPELSQTATAANAFSLRTCRCSCGFPCTTNADCGPGGVCAPGITCCATGSSSDVTTKVFKDRESLSSRQTPSLMPDSINCKTK